MPADKFYLFKQDDEFELDEVNRVMLSTERLKNSITNCSAWILAHNKEAKQPLQPSPTPPTATSVAKSFNAEVVNMEIEDPIVSNKE